MIVMMMVIKYEQEHTQLIFAESHKINIQKKVINNYGEEKEDIKEVINYCDSDDIDCDQL